MLIAGIKIWYGGYRGQQIIIIDTGFKILNNIF